MPTINTGATGVTANCPTFAVSGYTIQSAVAADVLTLAGTAPAITVASAGDSATIQSIVAGTAGLTKAGVGTLTLLGANTFASGLTVNSGLVAFTANANFGDLANTIALDGGGISYSADSVQSTFTRVLNVGASGGSFDVVDATPNVTMFEGDPGHARTRSSVRQGGLHQDRRRHADPQRRERHVLG